MGPPDNLAWFPLSSTAAGPSVPSSLSPSPCSSRTPLLLHRGTGRQTGLHKHKVAPKPLAWARVRRRQPSRPLLTLILLLLLLILILILARAMISRVRAKCAGRECSVLLGGGERLDDKVQWSVKLTPPFNPRLLSPSNGV